MSNPNQRINATRGLTGPATGYEYLTVDEEGQCRTIDTRIRMMTSSSWRRSSSRRSQWSRSHSPEGEELLVEEEGGPDFARGQEDLPESDARPDFARGQEDEPPEPGKPDYARGQREDERDPEAPDFARGQRDGELLDAELLEEDQNPPQV